MRELTAQQRWTLFAASIAVGLAFLDETAVVTALPTIQREFGASSPEMQWVMGAYLLGLASLMAAAGRLADLYGRRRVFVLGAALFGVGSVACAAAPNEELLIAARGLQGVGGALLIPLGYANATAALPEDRHGWAIGLVSTGATVFLALGPLIGGALTQLAGWRWIFLINIPAILAIVVIALRSIRETKGVSREPLDWTGLGLLTTGLVSLVLALLNMRDWGPGSPVTLGVLGAGIALLAAFVVVERRAAFPLIRLEVLRVPAVATSLCALFAIQFAILGLTVYLTLYLQLALRCFWLRWRSVPPPSCPVDATFCFSCRRFSLLASPVPSPPSQAPQERLARSRRAPGVRRRAWSRRPGSLGLSLEWRSLVWC